MKERWDGFPPERRAGWHWLQIFNKQRDIRPFWWTGDAWQALSGLDEASERHYVDPSMIWKKASYVGPLAAPPGARGELAEEFQKDGPLPGRPRGALSIN